MDSTAPRNPAPRQTSAQTYTEFDGPLDGDPTGGFVEFDGQLDGDDAQAAAATTSRRGGTRAEARPYVATGEPADPAAMPLPQGVTPSTAGAGRSSADPRFNPLPAVVRTADSRYADRGEAIDDAVNQIELGAPAADVFAAFEKLGVTRADIVARGRALGNQGFVADARPVTVRAGAVAPESTGTVAARDTGFAEDVANFGARVGARSRQAVTGAMAQAGVLWPDSAARLLAQDQKRLEAAAPGEEVSRQIENLGRVTTYAEIPAAIMRNPKGTLMMLGESLAMTAPLMAASAARLPAAGLAAVTGASSAGLEFGSSLADSLADRGVSLLDVDKVSALLKDGEFMADARSKAATRGVTIGAFDALSAGFASRFVEPALAAVRAGKLQGAAATRAVAGGWAKDLGMQAAAGAGGEFAAQKLTGDDKPLDVAFEALGEVAGAPLEVRSNLAATRDAQRQVELVSFTEPDSPSAAAGLTPIVVPQLQTAPGGVGEAGATPAAPDSADAAPAALAPVGVALDGRVVPTMTPKQPAASATPVETPVPGGTAEERLADKLATQLGIAPDPQQVPATDAAGPGNPVDDGATVLLGRDGLGFASPKEADLIARAAQKREPGRHWVVERLETGRHAVKGHTLPSSDADSGQAVAPVAPEAAPDRDGRAMRAPLETTPAVAQAPAAPRGRKAATWAARRGEGYATRGDAVLAIPGRVAQSPALDWQVEPLPNGRFQLAGYEDAGVSPSSGSNRTVPSAAGGPTMAAPQLQQPQAATNEEVSDDDTGAAGSRLATAQGRASLRGAQPADAARRVDDRVPALPSVGGGALRRGAAALRDPEARARTGTEDRAQVAPAPGLSKEDTLEVLVKLRQGRAAVRNPEQVVFEQVPAGSDASTDAAVQAAQSLGLPLMFVRAKGRTTMSAARLRLRGKEVLVLREGALDAPIALAMHETVHTMPVDIKRVLVDRVVATVSPARREQFLEDFDNYRGEAAEQQNEEIVAMLAQSEAKTPEFWTKLSEKLGDGDFARLARHVLASLDRLVGAFRRTGVEASQYTDDIEAVRDALTTAFAETERRTASRTPTGPESASADERPQFSEERTGDNERAVPQAGDAVDRRGRDAPASPGGARYVDPLFPEIDFSEDRWYSGTTVTGLTELDPAMARDGNLYGPAVYLARGRRFAETYARGGLDADGSRRPDGTVYEAEWEPAKALDMGSMLAAEEAMKIAMRAGTPLKKRGRVLASSLYEDMAKSVGKARANAALRALGYDTIAFRSPRGDQLAAALVPVAVSDARSPVDRDEPWPRREANLSTDGLALDMSYSESPAFKKWFADSKVVDADGAPLVVFHGTRSGGFNVFRTHSDGSNTGNTGYFGSGAYFSPDADNAGSYGRSMYEVYLSIQKPFRWNDSRGHKAAAAMVDKLMAMPGVTDGERARAAEFVADIERGRVAGMPKDYDAKGRVNASMAAAHIFDQDDRHADTGAELYGARMREVIEANGFDGVIAANAEGVEGATEYVAFKPEQIKSATGNTGAFSTDNPDIRYSDGSALPPAETLARRVQRYGQDAMNRFTVVRNWGIANGAKLSSDADVWAFEERMHGRIASRVEDFRELTVKPLVKRILDSGFTMAEVGEFLHMQHAEERNRQVAKLDPAFRDGSGISTAAARAYLAKADPRLAELANEMQSITARTLSVLSNAGIIGADMRRAFSGAYRHYVPLRGTAAARAAGPGKVQAGNSVSGDIERAQGRGAGVDPTIVANILRAHERAITQAERNVLGHSLIAFVTELANPGVASIGRPQQRVAQPLGYVYEVVEAQSADPVAIQSFAAEADAQQWIADHPEHTGLRVRRLLAEVPSDVQDGGLADNEVRVYVAGHAVKVQLQDAGLLRAYQRLGFDTLPVYLRMSMEINRMLATAYTGWNPEFAVTNAMRDFTTGVLNITGQHGAAVAAKAVANYPRALATLMRRAYTGKSTALIDAYRAAGGSTGAAWISDIERIGADIQRSYDDYVGVAGLTRDGKPKAAAAAAARKVIRGLTGWIEALNQATENAFRLAVFEALRKDVGINAAASAAKNSTVNFNRRGELGHAMSAMYLFFNPAVQGTAAIASALTQGEHRGQARAAVAGLVALTYALAALQYGDDEDDEFKKIPGHIKDRSLIIRLTEGRYITIPIPYGYGLAASGGNAAYDLLHGKDFDEVSMSLASSVFENFSPVGNPMSGSNRWSDVDAKGLIELVPGIPFGELTKDALRVAANRSSFGHPNSPAPQYDADRPDFLRMWHATKGTAYDKLSSGMSRATGGTASQAGGIDVSPETLKFWTRSVTGGVGTFVADTARLAEIGARRVAGEEGDLSPRLKEIPVVRRLVRDGDISDARSLYWTAAREAKKAAKDYERALKAGDEAGIDKILASHERDVGLAKMFAEFNEAIAEMRAAVDEVVQDDSLSLGVKRIKIKEIEGEERQLYEEALRIHRLEGRPVAQRRVDAGAQK